MNPLHYCDIKIVSRDELMKDIPDLDKLVGAGHPDDPGEPGEPGDPEMLRKRNWRWLR